MIKKKPTGQFHYLFMQWQLSIGWGGSKSRLTLLQIEHIRKEESLYTQVLLLCVSHITALSKLNDFAVFLHKWTFSQKP